MFYCCNVHNSSASLWVNYLFFTSSNIFGTFMHFFKKWVVINYVSINNFLISLIWLIRSSSETGSYLVLKLGSLGHSVNGWPSSLQQVHLTFLFVFFISSSSFSSSSSSYSLQSCLSNLQPRAFYPNFKQHHHISPPYSE